MENRKALGSVDPLFSGGGNMGAFMRGYDWSTSPLGRADKWPQSLRTSVSIVLDSYFPMYIAWGNEFIQFYNDGYRPILGATKHPGALGSAARKTFAESWHIIGPMFEDVMRGKAIGSEDWMLPLDRNGYLEECYFTYSYSPIRVENGDVGGVLVTVSETTGRVVGERRLRTLSRLAAEAVQVVREVDLWQTAISVLSENAADLPFAALYVNQPDCSVLVAGTVLPDEKHALPDEVAQSADNPSPLASGLCSAGATVLTDQAAGFAPFSAGPWPESIDKLVVLPIIQSNRDEPYGALVVGISPRRALDDDYHGFLDLVAGQISTALTRSQNYEAERERAEALEEIDRAKTLFFSNVSHEFRTPLTLMLGNLEEAALDASLPASEQERLQVVRRNALRLLKLVNTLLDFSRIEAGRVESVYQPTDLSVLTAELAAVFRSTIERAGLRLVVDCPPLSEPVYVDRDMWEKIVLNLLSNAFKHTFEGEICVALHRVRDDVQLVVSDTGVGIPQAELDPIFERFHRVRDARARSFEGTGIGLSLVQELVRLHKGGITVESVEDEGSRFVVTIPTGKAHLPAEQVGAARLLNPTAIGPMPFVEEARRWLPDSASTPGDYPLDRVPDLLGMGSRMDVPTARILVVDDNADMRDYLYRLLSPAYEVLLASNGVAALEQAQRVLPDLILADVMMPGIDGFELLRTLRDGSDMPTVPLILLSANADEGARVAGLQQGADDYLVKPFSARELLARVRSHLDLAQMRLETLTRERHTLAQLQQLTVASLDIHSTLSVRETLDRITHNAREIIGAHVAVTSLIANEEQMPAIVSVALSDKYAHWRGDDVPPDGSGIYALVTHMTQPIRLTQDELIAHPAWKGYGTESDVHPPLRGWLAAPMLDRGGHNLGLIQLSDRYEGDFTEEDEAILMQLSTLASVAVENARLYDLESKARAQAEQANALKLQFLAMISHELRTPLASIKGFLSTLLAEDIVWDAGQQREFLSIADDEADKLTDLIGQLLDVSRIQAGTFRVHPESHQLTQIIGSMLPTLHQLDSIHRLVVNVPVDLPLVRADDDRVAQVIYNLVDNAGKYSPSGAPITLSAHSRDGFVQVDVSDEGEGIPLESRETVFEAFRQLDGLARQSGTGLGLAICKGIVEAHGGRIWIQERATQGTTVSFTLPLA